MNRYRLGYEPVAGINAGTSPPIVQKRLSPFFSIKAIRGRKAKEDE